MSSSLSKGTQRVYTLCVHLAIGASLWGYNVGILSSVLVHPGWRSALGDPAPSTTGLVTGAYYLGTLASYLFLSHPLADHLGRRRAAMLGTAALCLGAALMAAADGDAALGAMLGGRLVCGAGVGVVSTSVPLYQSEVSPARERGKFVTMNHGGFIAGLAAGLWVGYGFTFWSSDAGRYWGWRVSILIQLVPAVVFITGLPFLPDTPRWLIQKGRAESASRVLHSLRQGTTSPRHIAHELRAITSAVESRRLSGIETLSSSSPSLTLTLTLFRNASLFARLWRAFLLQFMAQMCGAAAMKYYLPTLLEALGLDYQFALMAGAVEMTGKIGMTVVEMWAIDRFGRRGCLSGGSVMMGVAMMINGFLPLLYPGNENKVSDVICIVFIFVYAMGYSLGLGPAAWVYSAEIFPTYVRARGLNFAASGGSIGSILASQIWPVGHARFGSGVYFFFMIVNFTCVPIIWFLYPETNGRALEDMDSLFGKSDDGHAHAHVHPDGVAEDQDHAEDGHVQSEQDDEGVDEHEPLIS